MTIIYLFDVRTLDDLERSIWFTRGWTQELLAPSIIQFYNRDWPLLVNGSNHKMMGQTRRIVMGVTRIGEEPFLHFQPMKEHPRTVLTWASKRKTQEVEDAAYSIMALFGLNLPIQYSDKDRALGRLLSEIVARSGDISIFDWVGEPNDFNSRLPVNLACFQSPAWTPPALSAEELQASMAQMAQFLSSAADVEQQLHARFVSSQHRVTFASHLFHLPCIVHDVEFFELDYENSDLTLGWRFTVKIVGGLLDDLSVITDRKLKIKGVTYCMVRVWHADYLASFEQYNRPISPSTSTSLSASSDVPKESNCTRAVANLLVHLAQPFHALLLVQEKLGGDWRRIATLEPILARVRDVRVDARMLEIKQVVVR